MTTGELGDIGHLSPAIQEQLRAQYADELFAGTTAALDHQPIPQQRMSYEDFSGKLGATITYLAILESGVQDADPLNTTMLKGDIETTTERLEELKQDNKSFFQRFAAEQLVIAFRSGEVSEELDELTHGEKAILFMPLRPTSENLTEADKAAIVTYIQMQVPFDELRNDGSFLEKQAAEGQLAYLAETNPELDALAQDHRRWTSRVLTGKELL